MPHDRQASGAVPDSSDGNRLIVCCDGTGNEIAERTEKLSNVLKLFRCLRGTTGSKTRQIAFYHPGIGQYYGQVNGDVYCKLQRQSLA